MCTIEKVLSGRLHCQIGLITPLLPKNTSIAWIKIVVTYAQQGQRTDRQMGSMSQFSRKETNELQLQSADALYCEIIYFRGAKFSWIHENGYIRGDVISWVGWLV